MRRDLTLRFALCKKGGRHTTGQYRRELARPPNNQTGANPKANAPYKTASFT